VFCVLVKLRLINLIQTVKLNIQKCHHCKRSHYNSNSSKAKVTEIQNQIRIPDGKNVTVAGVAITQTLYKQRLQKYKVKYPIAMVSPSTFYTSTQNNLDFNSLCGKNYNAREYQLRICVASRKAPSTRKATEVLSRLIRDQFITIVSQIQLYSNA
jgi:hypothetical protein